MDSWHNIQIFELRNEKTAAGSNFKHSLDQIPLDPGCPATAKSLAGVERSEIQDTDKKLL